MSDIILNEITTTPLIHGSKIKSQQRINSTCRTVGLANHHGRFAAHIEAEVLQAPAQKELAQEDVPALMPD